MTALDDRPAAAAPAVDELRADLAAAHRTVAVVWRRLDETEADLTRARQRGEEDAWWALMFAAWAPLARRDRIEGTAADWLAARHEVEIEQPTTPAEWVRRVRREQGGSAA